MLWNMESEETQAVRGPMGPNQIRLGLVVDTVDAMMSDEGASEYWILLMIQ